MVRSTDPHSTESHNGHEPLQKDKRTTPQPDSPNRRLNSPLNPNAPAFILPEGKSKQGPSREHLRSIIAEKEQQRRRILNDFTRIGKQLKSLRRRNADLDELPDTKQHLEQHPEPYEAREQEFDEIEEIVGRIGDKYKALCDEIEELWGALAMASE